jgi:hypothetical protein
VSRAVVEDLLADWVTAMAAAALRVREDTVVRSYLPTISPADMTRTASAPADEVPDALVTWRALNGRMFVVAGVVRRRRGECSASRA